MNRFFLRHALACGLAGIVSLTSEAALVTSAASAADTLPPLANQRCLRCHADSEEKTVVGADGKEKNIYIEASKIEHSVHGQTPCVGCHRDVTKLPHAKPLAGAIGCIECHRQEAEAARRAGDEKRRERLAVVLTQTDSYLHSVHARPSAKDQARVSAACHDCHDAHDIGAPGTLARKEHRLKNPEVCGRCHLEEKKDYLSSVHGRAVLDKGDEKSAVCSDCHTTHAISDPKSDPAQRAITANCGNCHEKARNTYFASYHGQVHRLGYTHTAKCSDCHGGHDILPADDPASRVAPANRLANCRECHKNANDAFLQFQPHGDPDDREKYPWLWFAKRFMQALIFGVMAFFWAHTLLWLYRELADRLQGKGFVEDLDRPDVVYFRRFPAVWRWIHALFALSTMTLILTGTTLLFSHTDWAKAVVVFLGGPQMEGIIHRTAAVIWLSIFVAHLVIALATIWKKRKTFSWFGGTSMIPSWKDLRDLRDMFKWFVGRGPRPEFCHWTYWQKFDYWAPFWGAAVIGSSGIILFAPETTAKFLPGWVFNVATLVHAEEALLAAIFLNTVHFFNVHFRPERFPMSTTIFTGAIPIEEFKHDHRLEYERLLATGELDKYLVKRLSRRVDLAASFVTSVFILMGLTLLSLVLYGLATAP